MERFAGFKLLNIFLQIALFWIVGWVLNAPLHYSEISQSNIIDSIVRFYCFTPFIFRRFFSSNLLSDSFSDLLSDSFSQPRTYLGNKSSVFIINPFLTNIPILKPLKTPETKYFLKGRIKQKYQRVFGLTYLYFVKIYLHPGFFV